MESQGGHRVADAESLRLAMLCLVPTGFWAAWHYFLSARHIVADEGLLYIPIGLLQSARLTDDIRADEMISFERASIPQSLALDYWRKGARI